ncbi:hypothetical protein EON79_16625 [bacterium]|nr:MAG: hypothetical protein EON79_16625 [bacterium]
MGKGYELLFPQYAPLKEGARTADTLARLDAHRADWPAATQDLLDAADPWLAYGDQPTIIGEYVRSADLSLLFRSCGAAGQSARWASSRASVSAVLAASLSGAYCGKRSS